MQAVILAAGMGKRLKELTQNATKCMVKVNGETLIERALTQLDRLNLSRIVLVIGYQGQKLKDYVAKLPIQTPVEYVENSIYDRTNNIYSLYLARGYLLAEDTLLLESDIIFEENVLKRLVDHPYPSLALVARYESWMDGTVVTLDEEDCILDFIGKKNFRFEDTKRYYKTVNIYKFSKEFSASHYVPFLEAYCKALGNNEYYEQVLKVITLLDRPEIKAVRLEDEIWYEIDDEQDLDIAESLFAKGPDKLKKYQKRYGGYWRYPGMLDFCYLVNPFYPCPKLLDEMKASFDLLVGSYPSGMEVNSLLAAKYFGLKKEQVLVGNGAAELIKALMEELTGRIGVVMPTFEEYPNRVDPDRLVCYVPSNPDFAYTSSDLMEFFADKGISALVLINPDNPSGNFIEKTDLLDLVDFAVDLGITVVVDESFVDFADCCESATLLEPWILKRYPELIVVKSISKSYGVPGLRLGILASGNEFLIRQLKKEVAIWNINSFGEFYLQICEKYKGSYQDAIRQFQQVRAAFVKELSAVPGLRTVPTQANYVMCELINGGSAADLASRLLNDYKILIKDLSSKKGFENRQYIRLAVRRQEENEMLTAALRECLNGAECTEGEEKR